MLLNSVLLVLREVLEAALLVSALLALARTLRSGFAWLLPAAVGALLGIYLLAHYLGPITDMLNGSGQEVCNAALQLGVFLLILLLVLDSGRPSRAAGRCRWWMGAALVLAVTREGAEVQLYVSGFAGIDEYRRAVLAGSAIGAGIGVSVGILVYAALRALGGERTYRACLVFLCLVGAGMVMQALILLEQAAWLPAGAQLWDSSTLISEQSLTGELLYAVFGYEATPGLWQLLLYLLSLLLAAAASLYAVFSRTTTGISR